MNATRIGYARCSTSGQESQNKVAPNRASSIPDHLWELPESVVEVPPVETRISELPFDQLSWQDFERLVFRLARKDSDVQYCARYGSPGQAQHGIDVYARLNNGRYICWQVKHRKDMKSYKLNLAVDDFLDGKWAKFTECFILCVSASLANTRLQDTIEAQAARLLENGIKFEGVDGFQLSEKLRSHPEIVDDFFGRNWLIAFSGEEAAASLKRPLAMKRVIDLRKRLSNIYEARAQQLDPGLNVNPARRDTSDLRKRFVVPYVDPENPFLEPSMDTGDRPTETSGQNDGSWEFDEYSGPGIPTGFRGLPRNPSVTPSFAFDDWLLQGEHALLLSGAPGSGKSTVLRCLALDLVHTPELFPTVYDRIGGCIPLLIPFALWSRLTAREQREVGLEEVIRETYRALVPEIELENSFIKALFDERLVLLIDGLDEYSDVQAARTTLATIETFVRTHDVFTIVTARPAGLRHLGQLNGYWKTARLVELQPRQQRDLAAKLLGEDESALTPVALRVDQFFQQLEQNGRLQSLAGNPLLLHGMLSVVAHQIILPNTRFELFQKLIGILLQVHPNRRATAAAEVTQRTHVFSTDDVRSEALAKLAFEVQMRGADAGIERVYAHQIIKDFLSDTANGPAWSVKQARQGAQELTNINADTSGLLVESGPEKLAFCHAAFREYLAGLELATWTLEDQVRFVCEHAGEPRWRGVFLALLQSLKRKTDVERLLETMHAEHERVPDSTDRLLLLADGAFTTASFSGPVGRRAALYCLDRIEAGTDDAEGLELLSLVLDGPRTGPIGDAIVARLARWWPGVTKWQEDLYTKLGRWHPTEELAQTLQLALVGDENQLAAAASLAMAFESNREIGDKLKILVQESTNPRVTATALDALSRGWSSTDDLDKWLHEAEVSPSIQLRTVAALALYRRGRRGDVGRDSLLHALGTGWNRFYYGVHMEIIDALVADWANDGQLHDACWAGVGWRGPLKYDIRNDHARLMLMRLHREDSEIPRWIQQQIESDSLPQISMLSGDTLLEPILSEHANVRKAVEARFEKEQSTMLDREVAILATMLRSDTAKRAMINKLTNEVYFRFWPVWSLLHGWGIDDLEVADALIPLTRTPPEERQYIAHHIPEIVRSDGESFRLLMEICGLPEVSRMDFVIRGFATLGNEIDEREVVSAIMPHFGNSPVVFRGEGELISRFHADSRVRTYALERLQKPSPPLVEMAGVYDTDTEIAPLILQRVSPLPTVYRRYIARRATQRFNDEALRKVLQQCDLETDEHAMLQATIGLSYAALATPGESQARTEVLRTQLHAVGFDYEARRVAAFGGLLALGCIDVFDGMKELGGNKSLRINLVKQFSDYAPVLELTADRWAELESAMSGSPISRLSRWTDDPADLWRTFAPYLNRSSLLRERFLEYCEDESVVLEDAALVALSRLKPGSSLLLDCCKRALTSELNTQHRTPLDDARIILVASKFLATQFPEDSSAVEAIIAASDSLKAGGAALVGLASFWPDQEVVVREYKNLEKHQRHRLLDCAVFWLLSAQGTCGQVAYVFEQFVTRNVPSPWDFPEDVLDAFRTRLERDPEVEETFLRLAKNNDEPSIRASTLRLLSLMSSTQSQNLAEELLAAECRRSGPPRFALDILTSRIRPAKELMRDVLRTSTV